MLTPEKIQANWEKHLKIVEYYIQEPRKSQVLNLLTELADKMVLAPASGKTWYHNSFPGGYIDHVNRVVESSLRVCKLWEEMGAIMDFTPEELVMSALFHDLGKIGDGDKENYLPQTDNWRKDKLQENYSNNKDLQFMLIQDRSLYLLQKYGISLTWKEFLGIRTHDGVFDDANKPYFVSHNPDSRLKTNLVHILHQGDYMASKVEYDLLKQKDTEK